MIMIYFSSPRILPVVPSFCDIQLKAKKPLPKGYPPTLDKVGDHLRKVRLDKKLRQKDVAKIIGVTEDCIYRWEKNKTYPFISYWPKIIEFLGYDPEDGR